MEHRVDFLVVGGVGAILQGATLSTFDLDIVHSTDPANIARLLAALGNLDACYRAQPEKRPSQTDLSSPGHQLLMTLGGHLKTGQSGSLQNRPVERIQDSYIFTSSVIGLASFFPSESSSAQQLGLY
ncbi:MAG: hypothetical protein WBL65_18430 [Bryobacteraceae bacterium]